MVSGGRARWLAVAGAAAMLAVIAFAALMPAGWQIHTGLHWLVEHFLAYLVATAIFCLAWPRPMAVAGVLLPFAVVMEAMQVQTPDRVAEPVTALFAAARVAVAALVADMIIVLSKRLGTPSTGPSP
jgi:hypothetical protein